MAHDSRVPVSVGRLNSVNRLAEGSDLVHFDQNTVRDPLRNPFSQTASIRYEQIVTDQLDFAADRVRQQFPSVPVVFCTAVFDRADRVLFGPGLPDSNQFVDLIFFPSISYRPVLES